MTHFIFKSANRLIKNEPINVGLLNNQIKIMMKEQRMQRQDLQDIKRMINKLLIDEHLQMQVDEYFKDGSAPTSAEPKDTEDAAGWS